MTGFVASKGAPSNPQDKLGFLELLPLKVSGLNTINKRAQNKQ